MLVLNDLKRELLFMMESLHVSSTHLTHEIEIINSVCKALEIDPDSLRSKNRSNYNAFTRFIIFKLLRAHTTLTFEKMGSRFNRDARTAMHGIVAFDDLLESRNKPFTAMLIAVQKELPGIEFNNPGKYG